jgi:hypothetical protein
MPVESPAQSAQNSAVGLLESEAWGAWVESQKHSAGDLEVVVDDTDVLGSGVNVTRVALQWAGQLVRGRAGHVERQLNRSYGVGGGLGGSDAHEGAVVHRYLSCLSVFNHPLYGIHKERPA